jgi:rhamnose utilization protein RhaD (predicted bifunctional aldolase and dehydrogenase)
MKSFWNNEQANKCKTDLELRVYSSRLLGQSPALVLHGGGNTSVKAKMTNLFGETEEILYVKGSGWDLATIEAAGFAPVRLDTLKNMVKLNQLADTELVQAQRAAMIDPNAPNPSEEAILHAIIPFKFVDHTHGDAVVTITNTENGEERIREIYGKRVVIIPCVASGLILAQTVYKLTQDIDWTQIDGLILMNHGLFTFAEDAKTSYELMIKLVTQAENYIENQGAIISIPAHIEAKENLLELANIRKVVCKIKGAAMIALLDTSAASVNFSNRPDVSSIATRGVLTPGQVIFTKRIPVILGANPEQDIARYAQDYCEYFERHTNGKLECLNPAPCWAIWPGYGIISFGRSLKEAQIISDITTQTIQAIQIAELLGGWKPLSESEIFNVEYREIEQAKLCKENSYPPLQGKNALVTEAPSCNQCSYSSFLIECKKYIICF